jgi:YD repeat-containing protein
MSHLRHLTHYTYADGRNVSFAYNPLRQLTEIQDWLGATSIELNPAGRALRITDPNLSAAVDRYRLFEVGSFLEEVGKSEDRQAS